MMDMALFHNTIYSQAQREKEKYQKIQGLDFFSDIMTQAVCRIDLSSSCSEAFLEKKIGNRARNAVYVILAKKAQFPFRADTLEGIYKKTGSCMSRINKKNLWEEKEGNYCLYVGSSKGSVAKRLVQHLGLPSDNPKVYALHLARWWPKAAIQIDIRQFRGEAEPYLQEIEDMLWDYYRPIFGRKGSK
jgi:hypothetical protein